MTQNAHQLPAFSDWLKVGGAHPQPRTLLRLASTGQTASRTGGRSRRRFSGNLVLSVKDGRFLLSIKAGLIVGAGIKGYMTFEVGYQSVIALSELVRQEMAANRYKNLDWVDGEAPPT